MALATYFSTLPTAGVSFYTSYPPSPPPPGVGPNQLLQIGMQPGTVVLGNLNTKWLYAVNGATALAQNAAANIDPVAFTVGGTGGIAGHSPIAVPPNSGAWFEISGATLSLAAMEEEAAGATKPAQSDPKAETAGPPHPAQHAAATQHAERPRAGAK